MSLTDEDKKWLVETIDERIQKALTVKVQFERNRDMKTGQKLAKPELKIEDVYLPNHWVEYIPYIEGALRGLQAQVVESDGKRLEQIKDMASILFQVEGSLKALAAFSDSVKNIPLLDVLSNTMIEDKKDDGKTDSE